MPVVTVEPITRPEQLIEYLADWIDEQDLGFASITRYEQKLVAKYPAINIQPGPLDRTPTGTHTFGLAIRAYMYVMHANMNVSRQVRSREDLELVTALNKLLESDLSLGGRIIHGFVENETPAVFPPRSTKGDAVIGTRILFTCTQQTRFK